VKEPGISNPGGVEHGLELFELIDPAVVRIQHHMEVVESAFQRARPVPIRKIVVNQKQPARPKSAHGAGQELTRLACAVGVQDI